ncbi:MAG: putative signal transducing protein [Bacteroidales bacterium]
MEPNHEVVPVEIFSGTVWQAEMVKSILENVEIEAFLQNETIGSLAPWYTASGGAGSVTVVVSSADYEKAKPFVEEFEQNIREFD